MPDEIINEYDADEAGYHADMQQMEFECRKHDVNCRICKVQQLATQKVLEQSGWVLTRAGEYCPAH